MNVDWTGESIWPSLHLPEKEEMQSYFIRKEKNPDTIPGRQSEQRAVSTFNAMCHFQ